MNIGNLGPVLRTDIHHTIKPYKHECQIPSVFHLTIFDIGVSALRLYIYLSLNYAKDLNQGKYLSTIPVKRCSIETKISSQNIKRAFEELYVQKKVVLFKSLSERFSGTFDYLIPAIIPIKYHMSVIEFISKDLSINIEEIKSKFYESFPKEFLSGKTRNGDRFHFGNIESWE